MMGRDLFPFTNKLASLEDALTQNYYRPITWVGIRDASASKT